MENKNNFWENEYSKGSMLNKYPFNYLVQIVFKYFGSIQKRSDINILEIGCGSGNNLHFLASEGFTVEGFDLSESAIDFAINRFKKDGLFISYFYNNNHPDKTFLKSMDVLSTPTKEEVLDLFSEFEIESITDNSTRDIFGKSILGEKSEYIIIVRKTDD